VRIVLVHGMWCGPEVWDWVLEELAGEMSDVVTADLPTMRRSDAGLADDVEHVRELAGDGPVVLCGHSYGGAVMTEAGAPLPDLRHLVYVATVIPEIGVSGLDWLMKRPFEHAADPVYREDGTIMPSRWFAADENYSEDEFKRMAHLRPRPFAAAALLSPLTAEPASSIPRTFILATQDTALHPDTQRETAVRADTVIEVHTDHMVIGARPDVVADVLRDVGH
jgi:pimeloyl-ACP methyl ester carboxylesterase